MSPIQNQVRPAVTKTTPREMAVFWTTESIVIRSPVVVGRRASA